MARPILNRRHLAQGDGGSMVAARVADIKATYRDEVDRFADVLEEAAAASQQSLKKKRGLDDISRHRPFG